MQTVHAVHTQPQAHVQLQGQHSSRMLYNILVLWLHAPEAYTESVSAQHAGWQPDTTAAASHSVSA